MKTKKVNKILIKIVDFLNDKRTKIAELILATMFVILAIILHTYALIVYGNTPVSEMPVWVYFMIGGR